MTVLRDATAALDAAVDDTLGDEITYTPDGGAAATFNAWVEFEVEILSGVISTANALVTVIEVPISTLAEPADGDRITITVRPGKTYKPSSHAIDSTGKRWRIILKEVAS